MPRTINAAASGATSTPAKRTTSAPGGDMPKLKKPRRKVIKPEPIVEEVDTTDDDNDAIDVGDNSIHTVFSMAVLYRRMCSFTNKAEGDLLYNESDEVDQHHFFSCMLHDIFGGISVAKPRTKPARLHAAYFKRSVTVVMTIDDKLRLSSPDAFDSAPILSIDRDKDTHMDKPLRSRMKLICAHSDWPAHMRNLLVGLDAFFVWCACEFREEIYTGSGLDVPKRDVLQRQWTKGMSEGDAPMRHFVSSYYPKDAEGNVAHDENAVIEFSINSRDRSTTASVYDDGLIVETAPAEKPGLLRRGDRVVPALALRGLNLLPLYKRIGPNVLAVNLWCKRRAVAAASSDDIDFSNAVEE